MVAGAGISIKIWAIIAVAVVGGAAVGAYVILSDKGNTEWSPDLSDPELESKWGAGTTFTYGLLSYEATGNAPDGGFDPSLEWTATVIGESKGYYLLSFDLDDEMPVPVTEAGSILLMIHKETGALRFAQSNGSDKVLDEDEKEISLNSYRMPMMNAAVSADSSQDLISVSVAMNLDVMVSSDPTTGIPHKIGLYLAVSISGLEELIENYPSAAEEIPDLSEIPNGTMEVWFEMKSNNIVDNTDTFEAMEGLGTGWELGGYVNFPGEIPGLDNSVEVNGRVSASMTVLGAAQSFDGSTLYLFVYVKGSISIDVAIGGGSAGIASGSAGMMAIIESDEDTVDILSVVNSFIDLTGEDMSEYLLPDPVTIETVNGDVECDVYMEEEPETGMIAYLYIGKADGLFYLLKVTDADGNMLGEISLSRQLEV